VQQAILSGRLPPGTKLPSSRALGADLGIARNTLIQVYDQLLAEGYVQTQSGSGTYVADTSPDRVDEGSTAGKAKPPCATGSDLSTRGKRTIDSAACPPSSSGARSCPACPTSPNFH
jgi:GntR family transcriptional regulator/MocR family aminotransferase